jgi:hypothetical protein
MACVLQANPPYTVYTANQGAVIDSVIKMKTLEIVK